MGIGLKVAVTLETFTRGLVSSQGGIKKRKREGTNSSYQSSASYLQNGCYSKTIAIRLEYPTLSRFNSGLCIFLVTISSERYVRTIQDFSATNLNKCI